MSQQYMDINAEIDALYVQLDAITSADWYDAQAYEQVAERLVKLEDQRDELLAGLLFECYNTRFTQPITRIRALELARHANEQRDNRTREVAA